MSEEEKVVEAAETIDAVVVIKQTAEDGSISTDVVLQGEVKATEVQTILELAVRGWRQRIGLVG